MRYSDLRTRCAGLVHRLDRDIGGIPRPFDLNELLDRFETFRGRPIDLHATAVTGDGPCGLWLRQAERDVIVYADNTSTVHQTHIVLHEIGHMVGEHSGTCDLALGPNLVSPESAQLAEHMLARSAYSSDEEQEAEMLGTLIRLAAATPPEALVDADRLSRSDSGLYERIVDVFG